MANQMALNNAIRLLREVRNSTLRGMNFCYEET